MLIRGCLRGEVPERSPKLTYEQCPRPGLRGVSQGRNENPIHLRLQKHQPFEMYLYTLSSWNCCSSTTPDLYWQRGYLTQGGHRWCCKYFVIVLKGFQAIVKKNKASHEVDFLPRFQHVIHGKERRSTISRKLPRDGRSQSATNERFHSGSSASLRRRQSFSLCL